MGAHTQQGSRVLPGNMPVLDQVREALAVAEALAREGHVIRAVTVSPDSGLPSVELVRSERLTRMAEEGEDAVYNVSGRDHAGGYRRGTFQRGRVRVVWMDRRAQ